MSAVRPKPAGTRCDEQYWSYAARDELRLQRCASCSHYRYPPADTCPQCLAGESEWHALSGKGTVAAWTIFHRAYFPDLPTPYAVVSVETAEGPLLIGNLINAGPAKPAVGMRVKAVFESVRLGETEARICQWEPLGFPDSSSGGVA
jgi:uncharacterized protein